VAIFWGKKIHKIPLTMLLGILFFLKKKKKKKNGEFSP
jgi:hypothetical protein